MNVASIVPFGAAVGLAAGSIALGYKAAGTDGDDHKTLKPWLVFGTAALGVAALSMAGGGVAAATGSRLADALIGSSLTALGLAGVGAAGTAIYVAGRPGPPAPKPAIDSVQAVHPALDKDLSTKPLGLYGGLTRVPTSLTHADTSSHTSGTIKSRTISLGGGAGVATDLRSLVFGKLGATGVGAGITGGIGWTKSKVDLSTTGSATTTSWGYTERPQRMRFDRDVTALTSNPKGFASVDEAIAGTRQMHGVNPYDRNEKDPAAMKGHVSLAYRTNADGKVHVYEIDAEQELSVIVDSMAITDPKVGALVIDGSVYRPTESLVNETGDEARLFEYEARAVNVSELIGGKAPSANQKAIEGLTAHLTSPQGSDGSYSDFTFTPNTVHYPSSSEAASTDPVEYTSVDDAIRGLAPGTRHAAVVTVERGGTTSYFAGQLSDSSRGGAYESLFQKAAMTAPANTNGPVTTTIAAVMRGDSHGGYEVRRFDTSAPPATR